MFGTKKKIDPSSLGYRRLKYWDAWSGHVALANIKQNKSRNQISPLHGKWSEGVELPRAGAGDPWGDFFIKINGERGFPFPVALSGKDR